MKDKHIILVTDHAGYKLKEYLKHKLLRDGFKVIDLGVYNTDAVDYPDIIKKGAKSISIGKYKRGIFLCGSGIGTSMAANRYKGVRAALVCNKSTAVLSRRHNDSNVIVLGGRLLNHHRAYKLFKIWWNTEFQGEERHLRRIKKLDKLGI